MLARAAVVLAVAIPLAWFFGRAICTDEMFGYRDAAHYYYPYYWYVHEHWAHGLVPLWNPLENLGQPLAADPTAAAFYPGKLIFFLPFAYDWLYKVYIVGHVALCAVTTYWLARQWQASRPAAGLAAVAYAFGGPVVFQYANVVYLVGAAWLPLALWGAHRIVVKREWWGVLAFAFAAAMMILGGDPEAAYLAALATLLLALMEWRRQATVVRIGNPYEGRASDPNEPSPDNAEPAGGDAVRITNPYYVALLLAAAFALAFGLSAIQLIPSIVWGQKTERALFDSPRSIYEIPSYLARPSEPEDPPLPEEKESEPITWYRDLVGQPQANTHHADTYRYSVGPWRFVELLWPNFYGREFPENRRWGSVLPQEESPWTPSLYFGLIPFLLMLTQLTFWSGPIRSRWLTWTMLILTLGSLGCYGIVWAIREAIYLCSGTAIEPPLGEGVGGVYWFFTVFLPGFVQFRYPAKLLVLAMLCAALLAARGLDRSLAGSRRLWSGAILVALISGHHLLFLVAFPTILPALVQRIAESSPQGFESLTNSYFGPLDHTGSAGDLVLSLAQAVIVSLALVGGAMLVRWRASSSPRAESPWPGMVAGGLVLVTGIDLAVAHAWSAVLVPNPFTTGHASLIRYSRDDWPQETSPNRLAQIVLLDAVQMRSKYPLLLGRRGDDASTSAIDAQGLDVGEVFADLDACAGSEDGPSVLPPLRGSSAVAIRRRSHHVATLAQPRRELMVDASGDQPRGYQLWLWGVVLETDAFPPAVGREHRATINHPQQEFGWQVEFLSEDSRRYRDGYHAELVRTTWLVLPERYDPDFVCEVTDLASGEKSLTPIYRAQRVLRGIHLPAGQFEVRFLYRPWSFYVGAALSLLAWPVGLWLVWRQWRAE